MIDIEYTNNTGIPRYDYKYLRMQGMEFCRVNWSQGKNLSDLLCNYLESCAYENGIDNVDITDCMGAIMHIVKQGIDSFEICHDKYLKQIQYKEVNND
jgi:hypothetical protein